MEMNIHKDIIENSIFEKIIKGHPSFIEKGDVVIKIMYLAGCLDKKEIKYLWQEIQKTNI